MFDKYMYEKKRQGILNERTLKLKKTKLAQSLIGSKFSEGPLDSISTVEGPATTKFSSIRKPVNILQEQLMKMERIDRGPPAPKAEKGTGTIQAISQREREAQKNKQKVEKMKIEKKRKELQDLMTSLQARDDKSSGNSSGFTSHKHKNNGERSLDVLLGQKLLGSQLIQPHQKEKLLEQDKT